MQENANCSVGRFECVTNSSVTAECDTACASSTNIFEQLIPDQRAEIRNFEQDLQEQNFFFHICPIVMFLLTAVLILISV